jgi:hypothetical protein
LRNSPAQVEQLADEESGRCDGTPRASELAMRKKLALKQETIRLLTDTHLQAVAGAAMNTRMAQGGAYCSTNYLTHCDNCTFSKTQTDVGDCRP